MSKRNTENHPKNNWPRLIIRLLVILGVIVAALFTLTIVAGLFYPNLFFPGNQWYNYSAEPSQYVKISLMIGTLGPQPVTVLDSDYDKVLFSFYTYDEPRVYQRFENGEQIIDIRMMTSDIYTGFPTDTYVYLPRGPNYEVTILNASFYRDQSPFTNKYSGGNITLWVDDSNHLPPESIDPNSTLISKNS